MKKVIPHTRMVVHPYVGEIPVSGTVCLNEDEVSEVFLIPIDELHKIEPAQYSIRLRVFPEEGFPYHLIPNGEEYKWREGKATQYFYQYQDKVIWGLTANILFHFLEYVKKGKELYR